MADESITNITRYIKILIIIVVIGNTLNCIRYFDDKFDIAIDFFLD